MGVREIEFFLRAKGQDEVKAAFEGVTGAMGRTERAEQGVKTAADNTTRSIENQARSTKQATSAIDAATQGFGKFGSTLGIAAQGVGRFNQGAGQIVGIIGQASGSIASMTASFGPLGFVIGAATAAFGVLSSALSESRRDMQATANVAATTAQAIEGMAQAIRRAANESRALRRLESGEGSVEETGQLRDVRYNQLRAVERLARGEDGTEEHRRLLAQALGRDPDSLIEASRANVDALASAFLRQARRNAEIAEDALDRAVARQASTGADSIEVEEGPVQFVEGGNIAIVNYGAELGMTPQQSLATFEMRGGRVVRKRRGGGRGAAERQRREEQAAYLADLQGHGAAQRARGGSMVETVDLDQFEDARQADRDKDQERIQGLDEMEREAHARRLEEHQERAAAWTRDHELRMEQLEEQAEGWAQIGATAVEVGVMIAKGDRAAFAAWARDFALRQLGFAGEEAAKAIGYAIEAPPLAAAHAAAAAKHAATAALFGAVSAAAAGGGGRGGGGASRPERFDRATGDAGGAGSITVIVDKVVTAQTHRELADSLERLLERGRSIRR